MHLISLGQYSRAFDPAVTTDIQALVMQLESVPLADLLGSYKVGYRYGYIGAEDRMMYPLITPGAIVIIDEARTVITPGPWRRESERPIYFLETREGFVCCWCAIESGNLILQPHPLSPEGPRVVPRKAVDVIGQITAVAMRLENVDGPVRNP